MSKRSMRIMEDRIPGVVANPGIMIGPGRETAGTYHRQISKDRIRQMNRMHSKRYHWGVAKPSGARWLKRVLPKWMQRLA